MKHFILLRLTVLLLGLGGALVLTPACKAQSEISPDHFGGTDSWATAARAVHAQQQNPAIIAGKEPGGDEKFRVSTCCGP